MRLRTLLGEVRDRKGAEGLPDPALLTYEEYVKVANPSGKSHGSDSYQVAGSLDYWHREDFRPVRRFKARGLDFELMIHQEALNYNKTNPANGELVRDENGSAVPLTQEEIVAMGRDVYNYTFAIFHDGNAVGAAQDEWGALLIMVVQEFQGFGLGTILGKAAREMEPNADSGGFTVGGIENLRRVHREFVKDYLAKGMYSQLVRAGTITAERAKEILNSASLDYTPADKPNVGPSGKKLMWSNNMNAWIVYDENLRQVIDEIQEGNVDEFFANKLIYAFAFTQGENPTYLYQVDYSDEGAGKIVLQAAMSETNSHGDELHIREADFFKPVIERVNQLGYNVGPNQPLPESEIPYKTFEMLAKKEATWRKEFDKYGEFEVLMQELAEKLFNH